MASEIRVNKIENRSGLGTVTFADTGVDLAGIVTATTFSGSGASLTNIPDSALSAVTASKLTGALPAISGASLTGMASTDNVRTGILDVAGISTFRNTMNVGAAVTISESGIEASGIGITCANINGTQIGGRRNIIINGAMNVAQRGTSSTSEGYHTVDRFTSGGGGEDEIPTQAQHTLSTSDTPYALGFRKSFHITNGNQTGGAGSSDYVQPEYRIEAQDLANSGWNYTDPNSFITLSFWVKSSVAGDYTLNMNTQDGTGYRYLMEYSLLADTWKHVVFKIPGNSNLTINDDNGIGGSIMWYPFLGSGYIQADQENNWYASSNSKYGTTSTTNWWTTNDSTWEITGVQLEVGDQATAFEHRSYGEELSLCQRYYETSYPSGYSAGHNFNDAYPFNTSKPVAQNYIASDDTLTSVSYPFMVNKRASPTVTIYSAKDGASGNSFGYKGTGGTGLNIALNVIQTREQQMMLGCSLGAVNQANELYFHYTSESEL